MGEYPRIDRRPKHDMGEAQQAHITLLRVKIIHKITGQQKGGNNGNRLKARPPALIGALGDEKYRAQIGCNQNIEIGDKPAWLGGHNGITEICIFLNQGVSSY